jgi:hypothetical protein
MNFFHKYPYSKKRTEILKWQVYAILGFDLVYVLLAIFDQDIKRFLVSPIIGSIFFLIIRFSLPHLKIWLISFLTIFITFLIDIFVPFLIHGRFNFLSFLSYFWIVTGVVILEILLEEILEDLEQAGKNINSVFLKKVLHKKTLKK